MTIPGPVVQPPSEPVTPRHVTVFSVNWANVWDFTHLFRGFRLAINPAKIMIALAAILLIYCAGRVFDFAWGPQVYPGEIENFQTDKADIYRLHREQQVSDRETTLRSDLESVGGNMPSKEIDDLSKEPAKAFRVIRAGYIDQFHKNIDRIHEESVKAAADTQQWANTTQTPEEKEQADKAAEATMLYRNVRQAKTAAGEGIFDSFVNYEIKEFDLLVDNTLAIVRVAPVRGEGGDDGAAVTGGLISKSPDRLWRSDTIVGCIANMAITGPEWLFAGAAPVEARTPDANTWWGWMKMMGKRALYLGSLTVLAIFSLLLLALAGAMITRLSAMELSGVDRAPLKDVFLFSLRRLWVFVKAPITPFLIILAIGCVMAIAGLMGAVPLIGPLLIGVLFVGFIVVGFVIMLLLLGVLGGFNLLYPTIAVEGSDSFDAMSRSFAYVYARPWRLIFYIVISLIYGVITFLFVSFAVYLVLAISHTFAGWGTNMLGYHYGAYSGVSMMDTLWPAPHFTQLITTTNWYAMSWPEWMGSLFLHFWVYTLATGIGAYVISYYFSSNTIIYLLMRRSVDGQALTEVFVEDEPVVVAKEETVTMGVPILPTTPPPTA